MRHHATRAITLDGALHGDVVSLVGESRRTALHDGGLHRRGRDLAQESHDLRGGERLLGDRPDATVEAQFGRAPLVEHEGRRRRGTERHEELVERCHGQPERNSGSGPEPGWVGCRSVEAKRCVAVPC